MSNFKLPIYANLASKQRQWVHMGLGGMGLVAVFLVVSALLGGDPMAPSKSAVVPPAVKSLGAVPGESIDPQAAWIGGAGKTITMLQADMQAQQQKQDRVNQDLIRELEELRRSKGSASAQTTLPDTTPGAIPLPAKPRVDEGGTVGSERFPRTMPGAVPPTPQRRAGPLAAGDSYPPGQPLNVDPQVAPAPVEPSAGMVKVTLAAPAPTGAGGIDAIGGKAQGGAMAAAGAGRREARRVETFLPVSFTRAVLLGGMDAPTGGQAQRDPVPVLLKLADNAFLPNAYRSAVKDCFVVAEGFGDVSAERAYLRTQLLSCVLKNGQSLEVPIKGSVFGEDGKNGMRGRLITKQGAILTNALLSGIAAGIGQGFAGSAQVTSINPLGSTTTSSTVPQDILRSGLGTGVARAMDRLAQYYINLAERTFPVIEIDAGRVVDIVITQGVTLDGPLAITSETGNTANPRAINHSALLGAVNEASDD